MIWPRVADACPAPASATRRARATCRPSASCGRATRTSGREGTYRSPSPRAGSRRRTLAPYPPGVPIVTCGERITRPIIEYLQAAVAAGALLADTSDSSLETIRFVAEGSRQ
ncbi:MAG TPA: hypothetical protein VGO31_10270 [Microbacteriaceae bacterium]|nr:hypothetical protein [Microbacteriaceae bacterium]